MSYTTAWTENTPAGASVLASDLDTVIQNLKRDIRERMDTILGAPGSWGADPVQSAFPARGVSVYHNNIHAPGAAAMVWNAERYDTDAFHDGLTGDSKLVVPTGLDGTYIINARMLLQSSTGVSVFELQIKKNGTTILARDRAKPASTTLDYSLRVTCIEKLIATDYVEAFFLLVSGGGTGNDSGGIDINAFEMMRVGP